MARFDLTDFEWSVIQPLLPTKVRGVPRADDRKVLNGIFWRLRTGAPWADIPARYGPHTTCVNRFNRWRRAGHCARSRRSPKPAAPSPHGRRTTIIPDHTRHSAT
jgi:transposase